MSLKEQAVIAMIKECIQPLLELKKGFEKQENRADDITEGMPVEKYPSVNAVINFVKNKITDFSNDLNTVYVKLLDFEVYKKNIKTSFENFEKGIADTYATKSGIDDFKNSVADTYATKTDIEDFEENVADTYATKTIVEDLKNDTEITRTATGSAITIDSAKAPLQNLKLFGKTTQNGTPTPSTPVPLVSVGDSGSFELGVYGGNIINEAHFSGSNGTDYVEFVNGKIHFVNASGNSFSCATITVKLPKGTYYLNMKTHSHTTKSAPVGIGQTTEQQYINGVSNSTIKYVFDKTTYLQIKLTTQAYKEVGEFYANVWLVAEKNCEYQPYVAKQSLTIPYTLRGIDDEDEIDFAGGIQIQRVREYSLIKFIGTCEQTDNTVFSNNILRFDFMYSLKSKPQTQVKSNRFVFNYIHGENASSARNTECVSTHAGVDRVSVLIDKSRLSTPDVAGFKEFLENNETIIQVVLATPNEVALTETELNAYRHLMTNKGNNTFLSEVDAEISFYRNTNIAQSIGNIHSQVNKDYFKLQQAIIETGGN